MALAQLLLNMGRVKLKVVDPMVCRSYHIITLLMLYYYILLIYMIIYIQCGHVGGDTPADESIRRTETWTRTEKFGKH